MTLPNLTWSQGDFVSTGNTAPTEQEVLSAIDNALSTSQYWEKKSSSTDYIEIGPKSTSAIPNFRAIFSADPGSGNTKTPDVYGAALYVGIAPDGGTLGTWNSTTPYGSNRWAGYWRCCATGVAESLYIVESDEVLAVIFRDDSLDKYYAAIVGAIMTAPDDSSAETDGRLYGMAVSGSGNISATFWLSTSDFINHNSAAGADHCGIFRGNSPTIWDNVKRLHSAFTMSSTAKVESLSGNTLMNPSVVMVSGQSPYYCAGKLRQMYSTKDFSNRAILTDSQGATAGYVFAPSSSSADSLLFSNF